MTETGRLATLAEFDLLDTPPDQALDDITELAAHVCDTPISLITLLDSDRQWFKSRFGWEVAETAREFAFCTYAIARPDEILVVNDATQDPRFADNPLVTKAPGIRFYAGWPLVAASGEVLGTLCVIDRKARILEPHQMKALQALRRSVMTEFELRRAIRQLVRADARNAALSASLLKTAAHVGAAQKQIHDLDEQKVEGVQVAKSLAAISQLLDRAQDSSMPNGSPAER